MRKGRDRGEMKKKMGGKRGGERMMKIVATTSLTAVDRPNADRWNAARSRQLRVQLTNYFEFNGLLGWEVGLGIFFYGEGQAIQGWTIEFNTSPTPSCTFLGIDNSLKGDIVSF